ncbi:AraC family transcriptional regulator [Paenibacillus mesophilus]|uniref:AraC family transcriptional regulator n=1 Tax=Paenibacillus mesophilus TaxID=2582849 RepID=UPI00110F0F85|nr:AraC family transcriptional regulator [Paenibacillus mesophilus]TMV44372.1 AraC family transcriptional regulator [Paenibacillus mesophilus]
MLCLELKIPPLPQAITVERSVTGKDYQHFRRCFEVYNIVFVKSGSLYITEDDIAYNMKEGDILVLEPGKTHWGHQPCPEQTELYWVHLSHSRAIRSLDSDQIPWSYPLLRNEDNDEQPSDQYMYLPKMTCVDPSSIVPLLERMYLMFHSFSVSNALPLHALLSEFLVKIQSVAQVRGRSRSSYLSERIIEYLQLHANVPLHYQHLEESLHYHFDYLSRCLKKHTGMTPLQYMRGIQIKQAKSLLEHTELTISEIGERIGLNSHGYLNRIFRQNTGMTPNQYRASCRRNLWPDTKS